jgi:hypothetical protein
MKTGCAALFLALLLTGMLPCVGARALPPGAGAAGEVAGAGPDPRLEQTGGAERLARQAGDLLFVRPFHLVRLVAGVALLPVALPTAAIFAQWRDALDICATSPYQMLFERPLGE